MKLEKNTHIFGILRIFAIFDASLAKVKNNETLFNKISRQILATTKLCTR